MAKELSIKIKVDGKEIDVAKKSTNELQTAIGDLKNKLADVPLGSKEFKRIQGDINELEKGFQKAKNATQPFLESMAELPGIAGLAGQSIMGLKKGFDLLAANPLIAVFTLIAMLVMKVVEKLKSMEAVADALDKSMTVLTTVINTLMDKAIAPLIDGVVFLIDGFTKLVGTIASWVGVTNTATDAAARYAAQLDAVTDAQGQLQIETAKSNAKIAEARERSNDANLSTKERIKALREAGVEEEKTSNAAKDAATKTAQAKLGLLAIEMNASAQTKALINKGTKESLEAASKQLEASKNLNRDKLKDAQGFVAQIYDLDSSSSLRQRRLATSIRSLENDDNQKALDKKKKIIEETKDFEKRLLDFRNDTRLNNITDEQEKARVSLEIDKKKTLDEISGLDMSLARKNELKLAAEKDFESKLKVLLAKQAEETKKKNDAAIKLTEDFNTKARDIHTAAIADETQRNKQAREDKYTSDVAAMQKDLEFQKKSKEEQTQILKDMEISKNNDIAKIDADAEQKRKDARLKELDDELKFLQIKGEVLMQGTRAYYENQRAILLLAKKRELEDVKLTSEQRLAIEQKYSSLLKKNKMQEAQAYMDMAGKIAGAIAGIFSAQADALAEDAKTSKEAFERRKEWQIKAAKMQAAAALIAVWAAPYALPPFIEIPLRALATVGIIMNTDTQIKNIRSQEFTGTGSSSSAAAATPSAPTGGQSNQLGRNYGDGGMIDGPRHAGGGVMINAEGGEAVMTRGAVTMFAPLLSAMNQMGGGTSFAKGATGMASYDNPRTTSQVSEQQIIKTYVVSTDMTNEQQKQNRLKDLSTL
jgi:hypothetical protein